MATVQVLHATTSQKYVVMTERGWDRTRNQAVTLEEHDYIILGTIPLFRLVKRAKT